VKGCADRLFVLSFDPIQRLGVLNVWDLTTGRRLLQVLAGSSSGFLSGTEVEGARLYVPTPDGYRVFDGTPAPADEQR
jgi:hypothetical protein